MHLGQRAYVLIVTAAVLAILGIWSSDPALSGLWRWPLILLLAGLAYEAWQARNVPLSVQLKTAPRAFLGRLQPAALELQNSSPRRVLVEYLPVLPELFEPLGPSRHLAVPARGMGRDAFMLTPVRLGKQAFPDLLARVSGALRLAWWSRQLPVPGEVAVVPDTLRAVQGQPSGSPQGARPRNLPGAGPDLHQLRAYQQGDPLTRIDWKASARAGGLITRELSRDQQLDILVALDVGRSSRMRAGRLERLALYANVAARFAELVTPSDDRIGLLVFAERPLAACAPARGTRAVVHVRRILEQLSVQPQESDPVAAALRIRQLLTHRSLVVVLTDLEDPSAAEPLSRAVRLLSPPHLTVVAGVLEPEITDIARREARDPRDPWIALAAREHEARTAAQRNILRRLGAPVIAAPAQRLEQAVVAEYETLRRSRRV